MEDNREKQLDDFIRKAVNHAGLESPANDFTQNILSKIIAETKKSTATVYQPLISRTGWLILAIFTIILFAFVIFGNLDLHIGWLPAIDKLVPNKIDFFDSLQQLRLPNTLVYAISGLVLFVYIQILYFKKYFENRYALN
jgi:hypothetical protein